MIDDRSALDDQITYYRRRAREYDETSTPHMDPFAPFGEEMVAALHAFEPRGKVLELACGTGGWTQYLVEHDVDVTALDSSPEMIELARAKVKSDRVRFVEADLFSWLPPERYEVVSFSNWLSHVPPTRFEGFWSLVEQCLAPGGRVFFADEAEDAWRQEIYPEKGADWIVIRRLLDGTTHRAVKVFWDPAALERRLRTMGWSISVHRAGPFYWGAGAFSQ
jgi:SAM-dependent methyltransferase